MNPLTAEALQVGAFAITMPTGAYADRGVFTVTAFRLRGHSRVIDRALIDTRTPRALIVRHTDANLARARATLSVVGPELDMLDASVSLP